ncbi:hypothetical protein [uncultured Algoriphagus sp.]|uniref:hypothetical protein n=1 Tax=uncultured Algoriphagus sp. TaxID=417365 RepID=UPI002586838F|nr:hypothetical protein [uncultured Algoriphagus sp.]
MKELRVFIENFPELSWYQEWIPIFIALISLIVSLISLWWNRKDYVRSSRPFIWASSYSYLDPTNGLIPRPNLLGFRITNSPAKILESRIQITFHEEILFNFTEQNYFRFPDENSEWSFGINPQEFKSFLQKANGEERNLKRIVTIKYSSLGGGKIYFYKLIQCFSMIDNQWKDSSIETI